MPPLRAFSVLLLAAADAFVVSRPLRGEGSVDHEAHHAQQGGKNAAWVPKAYIVFTAAGDHQTVTDWVKCGIPNFDVFVAFYGTDMNKASELRDLVTFFELRRGWKFNILYKIMRSRSDIFDRYPYVYVPDDDMALTASSINLMFLVTDTMNLTLSGASEMSTVSGWNSKLSVPGSLLRYGAFVEVSNMLFKTSALKNFYQMYAPTLFGYGFDLLVVSALNLTMSEFAVIDAVIADQKPRPKREIELLIPEAANENAWESYKTAHKDQWDERKINLFKSNWRTQGHGQEIDASKGPSVVGDAIESSDPRCLHAGVSSMMHSASFLLLALSVW